jgi:hypothetical protein
MKKVSDYKIICNAHVEELEKVVKACMRDGWELFGPPLCCQDRFCQALVKYEIPESDTYSEEVPTTLQAQEVRRGFPSNL